MIFGKKEQEKFEEQRALFSKQICDIYDTSKTYHDGKWMMIPVSDLDTLEEIKKMVMIKKKPNRKPFPKEQAIYSKCRQRCDLCIHYTGGTISEEFHEELRERLTRIYGQEDWDMRCSGCGTQPETDPCVGLQCAQKKGLSHCDKCSELPCDLAPVVSSRIEPKSVLADDVTWAILPYVYKQYGN